MFRLAMTLFSMIATTLMGTFVVVALVVVGILGSDSSRVSSQSRLAGRRNWKWRGPRRAGGSSQKPGVGIYV